VVIISPASQQRDALGGSSNAHLITRDFQTNDLTYYAWSGGQVIAEYFEPGFAGAVYWKKSYVFAGERLLSTASNVANSEQIEHHYSDRLGTRIVTNPNTSGYFEQQTLPFGTALNAESTGSTNQRYTSYDRSSLTGLDYAVNRTYDSGQNRFTSVDPLGMQAVNLANPQSLNLYSYAKNNPVNYIDPLGLNASSPGTTYSSGILWTLYYGNNQDGWKALFSWFEPYGGNSDRGDNGGSSDPGQVSEECNRALKNANKDAKSLERAKAEWSKLWKAAGGNAQLASILGAIGIRESGFQNISERGGGGRGIFQIDITQNPSVTEAQAFDIDFSLNWMINFLSTQYDRAVSAGTSSVIATAAAIHAYNSGPLVLRDKKLNEHQTKQLKNANDKLDPSLLDRGTARGNYVTNVLDIAFNCF